ncbi:MAG TPA: septum site-determining protein MinC [Chthoniobacterales bacterium]
MAFLFTPELPLENWLADLDSGLERSPGFFIGRPVVLDLSALQMSSVEIAKLIASLQERDIRIMGLEGVDPTVAGPGLPPLLRGGRATSTIEMLQHRQEKPAPKPEPVSEPAPEPPVAKQQIGSLVLQDPVRSGQSVVFKEGDVTVLGSVGSGAEIVAGGSIHIYGTLRGRAMAGVAGNSKARIFCHKIEAELLAIDGYYRTAEDISASLRNRPVQAWLDGSTMMITALN